MEKRVVVRYLVLVIIFAGLITSLLVLRNPGLLGFAVFEQGNESEFGEGNYINTTHDGSAVILSGQNLTGSYTSQIFDSSSPASWNNLSWISWGYCQQELPGNKAVETGIGRVDMSDNVLLMHMNEDSGAIEDTSGEDNDGAYNGALYSQTGKLNNALGFDGVDDAVDISDDDSLSFGDGAGTDSSVSISAWINMDDATSFVICDKLVEYTFDTGGSDNLFFRIYDGLISLPTAKQVQTTGTLTAYEGQWINVVATYDGSSTAEGVKLFIDGEEQATSIQTDGTSYSAMHNTGNHLLVGKRTSWSTKHADGKIDGLAIWNKELSADEILNIYKRGILRLNLTAKSCDDDACSGETFVDITDSSQQDLSGIIADNQYFQYKFDFETDDSSYSPELYNVTIDYTVLNSAPSVTLASPQQGATYGYNESLDLEFIASDADGNIDSCWYNIDSGNDVIIEDCANTTFDVSGDGTYNLTVYTNDTNGEEAQDSATFNVQVGAPTIELHSPIDDTYLNSNDVNFSYTPTDMDLDSCGLWGNFDSSFELNQTETNPTNGSENTFSLALPDGSYLWNIKCNDSQGNSAINGNQSFSVDTTAPGMSLSEPSGAKTSRTITASWDASDENLESCWYNVYQGASPAIINTSVNCSANSANFDVSADASFTFNFYANDSAGNSNSSSLSFSVDTSPSAPSTPPGPGGGGSSGGGLPPVSSKLEIKDVSNLIIDPGESKKMVLSVKNIGKSFLNECKIKGQGKNADWIYSDEIKGLSDGEESDFVFTLNIPEALEANSYSIELSLMCQETNKSTSFIVEIIERKLAIDLIDVEREDKDKIKIIYSLTELSGLNQEVEVEIALFGYNNERLAEITEIKSIEASSNKQFAAILSVESSLEGSFNLLINAISKTSSTFVQEEVILGSSKIGGLAILDRTRKDVLLSFVLIALFGIFAVFIVRRILKLRKLKKDKLR